MAVRIHNSYFGFVCVKKIRPRPATYISVRNNAMPLALILNTLYTPENSVTIILYEVDFTEY